VQELLLGSTQTAIGWQDRIASSSCSHRPLAHLQCSLVCSRKWSPTVFDTEGLYLPFAATWLPDGRRPSSLPTRSKSTSSSSSAIRPRPKRSEPGFVTH